MERKQDNEVIYADSPDFDNMIGMTGEDFASFVDTYVNGCAQWKPGVQIMTPTELLDQISVLRHVNVIVSMSASGRIRVRTKL